MKRLFLLTTCLLAAAVLNAQTLEDIVKKYSVASKLDQVVNFKTVKITAKMSVMGMEVPIELWMKNPNKIKNVMSFNGQDIVQSFDGQKGYVLNPMTGGGVTEMDANAVAQIQRSNLFQNFLDKSLKDGKLSLEGEEAVNGAPCFKLKLVLESGESHLFMDKGTYLIVKQTATMNMQGQEVESETFMTDYKDFNGIMLPAKTTISAAGNEMVMEYTAVEVNIPMEDSIFVIK